MERETKLEKINKTLEQLYNDLSKRTMSGIKEITISIVLLERLKSKLESE